MNYTDVPIWEKYTLTIEEAAKYFRVRGKEAAPVGRGKSKCQLAHYEWKPCAD